jgi:hypothetical protein
MELRELTLDEARRRFAALPPAWQVASLSPDFAQADARRDPALRCVHVALEGAGFEWLTSVHLQPLAGQADWLGAISPYGYGGALSPCEAPEALAAVWALWQDWCRSRRVVAELARFHPQVPSQRAFFGKVQLNRQTVSVKLQGMAASEGFNTLTRRKINRATRHGVRTRWSDGAADWARFADFYREGMRAIGARPFYLFADPYFAALRGLPHARLLVCEHEDEWLSAAVYLLGARIAEYHLGASSERGKALGTPYLLQAAAIERATAEGLEALYLGGGTDTRADNPLLFYKLGFSRHTLPFYVGEAVHDPAAYWALAARRGYSPQSPPPRVLLD